MIANRRALDLQLVGQAFWIAILGLLAAVTGASAAAGYYNGVVVPATLVVFAWFTVYWRVGLIVLLLLSCVDGFIKLLHGSLSTFVLKDELLALVVLGVSGYVALEPSRLRNQRFAGAGLVLFYGAFEAVEILNPGASKGAAAAGFRAHVFFSVLFFVGAIYFDSAKTLTRTAAFAVGGITFAAAAGILQFFLGDAWLAIGPAFAAASKHYVTGGVPGVGQVLPGSIGSIYRSYGTLVDPTALGIACAFGIIYATGQAVAARNPLGRAALILAMLVMTVALILSGTRSAMAAAAVGFFALMIIFALRKETRRFIFLGVALAAIGIPIGTQLSNGATQERFSNKATEFALETRQRSAALVLARIEQEPFGVGLGQGGAGGKFRQKTHGTTLAIDNLYLAVLYETGPLGLLAFLAVQFGLLFMTIRASLRVKTPGLPATYAAIAAGQIALLIAAILNQGSFDYAPLAQMFWLFSGAVAMPPRIDGAPPAIVAPAPKKPPLPVRIARRLQVVPRPKRAPAAAASEAVAPVVVPVTEAEIDAALDRFRVHLRATLLASAADGPWAERSTDDLFRLAGRKLIVELKRALAAADKDPASAEKAANVVRGSAEIAALLMMLSDPYEPPRE